MSSYLQNQLAAFRSEVSSSAARLSRPQQTLSNRANTPASSRPSPSPSVISQAASSDSLKRKRAHESSNNVVFSQPANTGTGQHMVTQVTYAIDYLKSKDREVTFRDIYEYLSIPSQDASARRTLERVLQAHPKIEYDRKGLGGKGSYRFRPTHNVRSADELHAFLQRQTTAQGISVKELKEGWTSALDAIDELESQHKLLVTRNKKDGAPRNVWPDDPSLRHDVESEFQDIWHKVKLPKTAQDLRRELIEAGLTPTSQVKAVVKGPAKEKKKKATRKGGKTTNTHMQGVLKDFSAMRK